MASASFTRDEVILALDVLYSTDKEQVSPNSYEMSELSVLLNRLPIHSIENRREDFRSANGITRQLRLMQSNIRTGKKSPNVGMLFFEVAFEFIDRHEELHRIATAIKRNEEYYTTEFGNRNEDLGFPEGILLGHLHNTIEKRDGAMIKLADHCVICNMKLELYYQPCGVLLEHHLIVPPDEIDGGKKYSADHFITVCPNCHAVLHHLRPWCTKEDCKKILR